MLPIDDFYFDDFGTKALTYHEKQKMWEGYIVINQKHIFRYQVTKNDYIILNDSDDHMSFSEIRERKIYFNDFPKIKDVALAFGEMKSFLHHLEKIKKIDHFKFEKNTFVHYNNNGRDYYREIVLEGFPLQLELHWDILDKNNELFFFVKPIFIRNKKILKIHSSSLVSYFGESFVRNIWMKAIKEDKNRLRLMNYKIRT